jgi:hypothetical protein
MTKLDRLRALSVRDWVVFAQLVAASGFLMVALRLMSWQRISRAMVSASEVKWARNFPLFHLGYAMNDLDPVAGMASKICRRNRCIVRSMMLFWLLRARGEPAELVFGVRKRAGTFEAHAWTLSAQGLVGDSPEAIADFQTMMTFGSEQRP